jgi:hypothetical protein
VYEAVGTRGVSAVIAAAAGVTAAAAAAAVQSIAPVGSSVFLKVMMAACDARRLDVVRVMMNALDAQLTARVRPGGGGVTGAHRCCCCCCCLSSHDCCRPTHAVMACCCDVERHCMALGDMLLLLLFV